MNRSTAMRCRLCGHAFDPGALACHAGCPLGSRCSLICCPSCGYQTVDESKSDTHRVFVDDRGVQWDAFAVQPSRSTGRQTLPAPYDKGWLAMQCPDGVRRVTPIPAGWQECSREELCRLLENAALAPRRTTRFPGVAPDADSSRA